MTSPRLRATKLTKPTKITNTEWVVVCFVILVGLVARDRRYVSAQAA